MDVLATYETIGVNTFGIVSDGGGGKVRAFRFLREKLHIDGCWPDINCGCFVNPIDPFLYIYYLSYSIYSLTFMRNNIYRSQPKLVRNFIIRGIPFGWKQVEEILIRDNERVKLQKGNRSDIVRHTVLLDKYTLMNATYVKQPFSEKTISEVISHLSLMLRTNIDTNITFKSQ